MFHHLYFIAFIIPLLFISCSSKNPIITSLIPPKITVINPIAIARTNPTSTVSARFTPPGKAQTVIRIGVILNRHRTINEFNPSEGQTFMINGPIPSTSSIVRVNLPNNLFPPNSLVTIQWFVDYRLTSGTETATTVSSIVSTRADCTPAQVRFYLRNLQRTIIGTSNPLTGATPVLRADTISIVPTYKRPGQIAIPFVPTHGYRNFIGQGTAFASPNFLKLVKAIPLTSSEPSLLLYTAEPNTTADQASEAIHADPPYTLAGFAFATFFSPQGPPHLGCMPYEAWFVHEAGFHNGNGSFTSQIVSETTPGTANPLHPDHIPNVGFGSAPPWHPRLWDVHLWINRITGIPDVSVCNVSNFPRGYKPNFMTCTTTGSFIPIPAIGSSFPRNGFFQPPLNP